MQKNRVEKPFLKFLLFYLANEEIQQKTEQENSKYIIYECYFRLSYSGFPCSRDERAGISKKFLSFFTLFLYIHSYVPWVK